MQQIAAIGNSTWDGTGHYGGNGGVALRNDYVAQFGTPALTSPLPSSSQLTVGGALGAAGGAASSAAGGAANATGLTAVADFLGKISSLSFLKRAGEVLGGAVLTGAGLFLLAKQIGLAPPPIPGPSRAVAEATPYQTSREGTGPPARVESFEPSDAAEVSSGARRRAARARYSEGAIPF